MGSSGGSGGEGWEIGYWVSEGWGWGVIACWVLVAGARSFGGAEVVLE